MIKTLLKEWYCFFLNKLIGKLGNLYIDFSNYILGHPKYNRMSQFRIEGIKTYEKKKRKKKGVYKFFRAKRKFWKHFSFNL